MTMYNDVLNKYVDSTNGAMVQREENRVMATFGNLPAALNFCLRVQKDLAGVGNTKGDEVEVMDFNTPYDENMTQSKNGEIVPLVAMGIHMCVPMCSRDAKTGIIKYSGPGVTTAWSLCTSAHVRYPLNYHLSGC